MSEQLSIEALREVGLFRAYGDTLLAELAAACRQLELEAGEALFDYGTPGHSMYIVLSGSVQIFRHEQLIAISRPYEPVGELALIDAEPRSTSARAIEPTRLLEITEQEFEQFLRPDAVALSGLLTALAKRQRTMLDVRQQAYDDLSMLLHDLRNFLTVLTGAGEVLDDMPAESPKRSLLEAVLKVQTLMDHTLRATLERSRGASTPYARKHVDLLAVVRDCLEGDLSQHPDVQGIRLRLEANGTPRALSCNEFDLRRVVANLVTNAAEASETGEEVVVTLDWQPTGVSIVVQDSGCGIPAEMLGRVFDTHFSTRKGHSGLGLSSCRRIVEDLHGGQLLCESRRGHGTRFECRLPTRD